MIVDRDIRLVISVPPHKLSENIDEEIKSKVNDLILKKEIDKLGFVVEINKIKTIDGGKIEFNTCLSKFNVVCNIKLYQLTVDEVISANVKEVISHGYFLDEPIEIFVGTETKPKVKVGDKTRCKITKIKYSNGKFIVIAKEDLKN
jgi:DNA-directed RNA polymerase subunit E'/Rpb7